MNFGKFEYYLFATGIFLFGLGAVKNAQMSLMFFDIKLGEHHQLIGGFFILVSIFIAYLGYTRKPLKKAAPPQQDQPRREDTRGGKKKGKKNRNKGG